MSFTSWVCGTVLTVRDIPGAERIWLAEVDADGIRHIVFGGMQVISPGDRVPVLLPGMRDITGRKVRARTYRGQRSEGILCSAAEAGLGDCSDRVHILEEGC